MFAVFWPSMIEHCVCIYSPFVGRREEGISMNGNEMIAITTLFQRAKSQKLRFAEVQGDCCFVKIFFNRLCQNKNWPCVVRYTEPVPFFTRRLTKN